MTYEMDDFNFKNINLKEDTYYNQLDNFLKLNWVSEVHHQLALNSITLISENVDNIDFQIFENNMNSDIIINNLFIENGKLQVRMSTSKWLCNDIDMHNYYPGSYSDEAMAYLYSELEQMKEINSLDIIKNENTNECNVVADVNFVSIPEKIGDLCSVGGYSISQFKITSGKIEKITFRFDESRTYNKDNVFKFQKEKHRELIKDTFFKSSPIKLPSGELSSPKLWMVGNINRTILEKFPSVTLDLNNQFDERTLHCSKILVKDVNKAILEVKEYPKNITSPQGENEFISTIIMPGYCCTKTNEVYLFNNDDMMNLYSEKLPFEPYMNTYTVNCIPNKKFDFELFNYN